MHKQPLRLAPLSTPSWPVFCSLLDLYINLALSRPCPVCSHLSAEPPRQRAPRPAAHTSGACCPREAAGRIGKGLPSAGGQPIQGDARSLVPTPEPPLTGLPSPGFPLKEQEARSDFLLTPEPTSLAADMVAEGPATLQVQPRARRHCAPNRSAGWEGTHCPQSARALDPAPRHPAPWHPAPEPPLPPRAPHGTLPASTAHPRAPTTRRLFSFNDLAFLMHGHCCQYCSRFPDEKTEAPRKSGKHLPKILGPPGPRARREPSSASPATPAPRRTGPALLSHTRLS